MTATLAFNELIFEVKFGKIPSLLNGQAPVQRQQ